MRNENPEQPPSLEQESPLLEREIRQALSATWPKSVQELLPGYLPDLSIGELSTKELDRYRMVYAFLGELVKQDEVEVVFVEEPSRAPVDPLIENEYRARPKFKLKMGGGKKEHDLSFAWQGNVVPDGLL